jgi:hypothetical protein
VVSASGRSLWNAYREYFMARRADCRRNPSLAIDTREVTDPVWQRFKTAARATYSWVVPTDKAIFAIAGAARRAVEIGAGSGYWASLMALAGIAM